MFTSRNLRYNTMAGGNKILGTAIINLKIFEKEKKMRVFVVKKESFRYDFLLGLDTIYEFALEQDCKGNISQSREKIINKLEETDNKLENEMKESEQCAQKIKEEKKESKEKRMNEVEPITVNWNEAIPYEEFEMKVEHLDDDKKKIIYDLVDEHGAVFAKHQFDVGTVKNYEASITLSEDKYVAKKPYRCSIDDQKEIEKQVSELLEHGIIEESCSPFAAPVSLAYKKTGEGRKKEKNRLVIDFRMLNKLVIPESTPFPLINDIITKTRGCGCFSTFDLNSAFWSIPIKRGDQHKTGFVTQEGHYQWKSLPFGLKSSPAIFQRIIAGIIRKYKLTGFACTYIDDILIFLKTFEEHIEHIKALIRAIEEEGFRLKFLKCHFAQKQVQYLGHVISENEVRPLRDNLVAIREFPVPKTKRNVRQFLGKVNFYHKYIPNASKTLEPFHRLLRKESKFEWSKDCQETFEKLKEYLTSAPALAIFDPDLPTIIYTDASLEGLGAVLKQKQHNGEEKPVAFFSKKLTPAQKKKKAIYIELIAVKEAVQFWQYWLIGRKFEIVTDHKPLADMNLRARPDEELGDIATYLLNYDFTIRYREGKENEEADALSRNPVLDPGEESEEREPLRTVNALTLEEIKCGQQGVERMEGDEIKHGVIFRKKKNTKRIVLNNEVGKKAIEVIHERFGHIGSAQMIALLTKQFHFRQMRKEIIEHCTKCEVCIKNKTRKCQGYGKLGHLGPASRPFQIMSLDTIGGFAGKRSTKKYIHLLVDHFTRFAYALTSTNQHAREFVRLVESVHKENPIELLLTDQYGGLISNEFEAYLESKGIQHIITAVDSAFSNGLNERTGQTLVNRIRCGYNAKENKKAWCAVAAECVRQYNDTPHSSTGFAPNYLLNGVSYEMVPNEFVGPRNLTKDRELAFERSKKSHERNKAYYDKNKKEGNFEVGEMVYVENGNKLNRRKLDEIRIGPCPIVRKLGDYVFEVDTGRQSYSRKLYHISKLVRADGVRSVSSEEA